MIVAYKVQEGDAMNNNGEFIYKIEREDRRVKIVRIHKNEEDYTKARLVRLFLEKEKEFFSAQEIADYLRVSRILIDRMIREKRLKTWELDFLKVLATDDVEDEFYWEEETEKSNFHFVIHKDDFKSFLLDVTESSYNLERTGFSIIKEQGKDVLGRFEREAGIKLQMTEEEIKTLKDDLYRQTAKQLRDKNFRIFLQHKLNRDDLLNLIDKIVCREVTLHSKSTLKEITRRGERTVWMFIKCHNSIRFAFSDKKERLTTRAIFDIPYEGSNSLFSEKEIEINNIVTARMKGMFRNKVRILEVDCPPWLPLYEYEPENGDNLLDYYSCYVSGYRSAPTGFCRDADDNLCFVVDSEATGWQLGLPLRSDTEEVMNLFSSTMAPSLALSSNSKEVK